MAECGNVCIRKTDGADLEIFDGHRVIETGISSVDDINTQMIEFIKSHISRYNMVILPVGNCNITFNSDDITLELIHIMRYRRCTIFVCRQESSRGTRYLAYIDNTVVHDAASFGTTSNLISNSLIITTTCERIAETGTNTSYAEISEKFGI